MATWAQKIKAHSAGKQAKPRKPKPAVQTTYAQTRPADSEIGDPGAVIFVHYTVDENTVTLTDEKGAAIGKANSYVMQPGEDAIRIAKRMALARFQSTDAPFNRRLKYPPQSLA
ncbi:hypothetical protein [Bradyrhizobium sp. McL0615]|uniref:hypothetical protein n=1 Tax=Bradyrhizobium sp. McL0615 TaxID=3415673 RepID=UPI003CF984D6